MARHNQQTKSKTIGQLSSPPHQPQSTNFLQLSHSQRERLKRKFSLIDGLRLSQFHKSIQKQSIIDSILQIPSIIFMFFHCLCGIVSNYCYNIFLINPPKQIKLFFVESIKNKSFIFCFLLMR